MTASPKLTSAVLLNASARFALDDAILDENDARFNAVLDEAYDLPVDEAVVGSIGQPSADDKMCITGWFAGAKPHLELLEIYNRRGDVLVATTIRNPGIGEPPDTTIYRVERDAEGIINGVTEVAWQMATNTTWIDEKYK